MFPVVNIDQAEALKAACLKGDRTHVVMFTLSLVEQESSLIQKAQQLGTQLISAALKLPATRLFIRIREVGNLPLGCMSGGLEPRHKVSAIITVRTLIRAGEADGLGLCEERVQLHVQGGCRFFSGLKCGFGALEDTTSIAKPSTFEGLVSRNCT